MSAPGSATFFFPSRCWLWCSETLSLAVSCVSCVLRTVGAFSVRPCSALATIVSNLSTDRSLLCRVARVAMTCNIKPSPCVKLAKSRRVLFPYPSKSNPGARFSVLCIVFCVWSFELTIALPISHFPPSMCTTPRSTLTLLPPSSTQRQTLAPQSNHLFFTPPTGQRSGSRQHSSLDTETPGHAARRLAC